MANTSTDGLWEKGRLSPEELAQLAHDQLGETPEIKADALAKLREKMSSSSSSGDPAAALVNKEMQKYCSNELWILGFLRASKFDTEKAFSRLVKYFTFMRITLLDLKPEDPVYSEPTWFQCNNFLGAVKFVLLPGYDRKGRRVMCMWDVANVEQVFDCPRYKKNIKLMLFDSMVIFEYMMLDEQTQICGFSVIEDLSQYGISMIWRFKNNPQMMELEKAKAEMMNDALPLRWGNMYILDIPWYFNIIWALVKPFMKAKITDRLIFMSSKQIEHVYKEDYHKQFLPTHFQGTLDSSFNFGEDFLRPRIEAEGEAYVPGPVWGGAPREGANTWDANDVCTKDELAGFKKLLPRGLEVFKKDRHGRRQKRVLYSLDQGTTLCFGEKVGEAKADKQFPMADITDVRAVEKGKGKAEGLLVIHPQRTLEVTVGSEGARNMMVKRLRGLVLEAAMAVSTEAAPPAPPGNEI